MNHHLQRALSDLALRESFDARSLALGRDYWGQRAVRHLEVAESEDEDYLARAVVSGTRPHPYFVGIDIDDDGPEPLLFSRCSCPVSIQCKHGAASAYALREMLGATAAPARWRHELQSVIDDLARAPRPTADPSPLALQFGLFVPLAGRWSYDATRPTMTLRPLRRGKKQRWVRSGANWSEIPRANLEARHDARQLDAVMALHGALTGTGRYWSPQQEPFLADFGQTVWRHLRAATEAGVEFVAADPLHAVVLLDDPLALSADVVSADGEAVLTVGVHRGDRHYSGDDLLTLGEPAHGVVLLDGGRAVLAPLGRRAPAKLVRLLANREPSRIPAADRADFEHDVLPQLIRHLLVTSSDASVQIPTPIRPRLRLTVEWRDASRADLRWEWQYADQVVPLLGAGRGTARDPEAEAAVVDALRTSEALGPLGMTEHAIGQAALLLAVSVLPDLRDTGLVDVRERSRPDFREAEGDPEIRFDVAEVEDRDSEGGPTDWLDLAVSIQVDSEKLPLPVVLEALTRGDEQIVLPSGLYVSTDRPELRRLAELVKAAGELREGETGISVGTHDLGIWAQLAELGVVDAQAQEWVSRAQVLRDLTSLPTPDPVGVVSTMRDYQLDGFRWLAFLWEHRLGGVLADDMGLGKTLQVLALISHARSQGAGPFLVVAPSSVVSAWVNESERHTPDLTLAAVTASAKRRGATVSELAAGSDVVVTTYTLLRLEREQYGQVAWAGMVLDEAQQVKNHHGKTYGAVRQIEAPFKLAVTGTPFENRLMEFWSLLSITCPGLYPWPKKFVDNVVRPVEKEKDAAALQRFRQRIRPFLLRRTKEVVARDLPPKQEQVLEVELGAKHRRVYDTHLQKERQRILGLVDDFDRNRVAIFSSLTRLRQLALDAGLVDDDYAGLGSAKLDLLVDHLEEITAEGHRALVFSQFTSFLARARDRLTAAGIETTYLDGKTRARGRVIDGFKTGASPVFLISLKAGGVGLTLTEADYVFVLDPWWNPATEAQAVDRAHRIGQDKPVLVYRLVATDTIEEKVMELKARKAELFAQVIDGDAMMTQTFGADDIRGLFD
ncbi:MAG: DEAD/DEAH box helicase [Nocardioides sp.]